MKKILRFASFVFFTLAFVSIGNRAFAEDKSDLGTSVATITVPDGLSKKEIQRSIIESATNRKWTLKDKGDDGKVVLVMEDGRWVARFTVLYDTKEVQIYSKSTRSGKPQVPDSWVKYLKQDIANSLNTKSVLK